MNKPLFAGLCLLAAAQANPGHAEAPAAAESRLQVATSLSLAPLAAPPIAAASAARYPRSLDEAILYALNNHLTNRSARLATVQADARQSQAQARFRPSIEVLTNIDYTENYDSYLGINSTVTVPSTIPGQAPVTLDANIKKTVPRYQIAPAVRLSYDLYNGGRDTARLQQSAHQLAASTIEQTVKQRDTAYRVTLAYLRLRQATLLDELAEQRAGVAEKRAQIAASQFAEKRLSQLALQTERLRLAEQRGEARMRANERNTRLLEYAAALGADLDEANAATLQPNFPADPAEDLAAATQWADDGLEYQRETANLLAAAEAVRAEQASRLPSLSLLGQYTAIGRDNETLEHAGRDLHRRETYLGLQLNLNLYDGALRDSRIAEKQAQQETARLRQEQLRRDIDENRRRNQAALRDAETQLELAQLRWQLNEAGLKVAQAQHASGLAAAMALEEAALARQEGESGLKLAQIARAIAECNLRFSASTRPQLSRAMTAAGSSLPPE